MRKRTRRLNIAATHALLLPTDHCEMESRLFARSKGLFRTLLEGPALGRAFALSRAYFVIGA